MCVICDGTFDEQIDIKCCKNVTEIPVIPGLLRLYLDMCPLIREIPNIPGLKILFLSECPMIERIPNISSLEVLYCLSCRKIREIPQFPSLERLEMYDLPLLKKIPVLPGIKVLGCSSCPLVEEIPVLPGLKKLRCPGCPLIKEIPDIPIEYLQADFIPVENTTNFYPNIPSTVTHLCLPIRSLLKKLPVLPNVKLFTGGGVDSLTTSLPNLEEATLCFSNTIPVFPKLERLTCFFGEMTEIPSMPCLKKITAQSCSFLTSVPPGVELDASNCPNLILPYSG